MNLMMSQSKNDEDDDQFEINSRKQFKAYINSDDWQVARTIFWSVALKGRIAIDDSKNVTNHKILNAEVKSLDLSRLDFYIGDHSNSQPNDNQSYKD